VRRGWIPQSQQLVRFRFNPAAVKNQTEERRAQVLAILNPAAETV
jgi:hypothetical protein